jgi:hypothetical protein
MGYFNYVPNFNYVDRNSGAKIGDYTKVKNLSRRIKLREDIFQEATVFEKYTIRGDDRPDNVANQIYGDPQLDWLVLISNNIINIQTEWPMPQFAFDSYLIDKYGSYENLNSTHHYETREVSNSQGVVIVPKGLTIESGSKYTYYDAFGRIEVNTGDFTIEVSNKEYEEKIEEAKRNISLIKPRYLPIILDDIESTMEYKKGSSDYISGTLKSSDNIRLTT